MDITNLSFNSLLLLERVQLSWFPGWLPGEEIAIALHADPMVEGKYKDYSEIGKRAYSARSLWALRKMPSSFASTSSDNGSPTG